MPAPLATGIDYREAYGLLLFDCQPLRATLSPESADEPAHRHLELIGYRPPQYERVMLPLTVLRRFDAVLASSKGAVLKRHAEKGIANIDAMAIFLVVIDDKAMNALFDQEAKLI